jgi:glycine cleavage system aminomethyltransferase T
LTVAPAATAATAINAPIAGADAGVVTSAAFSPLLGRAISMGYVRREYVAQQLHCGPLTAEVVELPLPDALGTSNA